MAEKVTIAYVHDDDGRVTAFEESLFDLVGYDGRTDCFLQHGAGRMPIRFGTDGLVAARNTVAARVVASDVDWLLWVDSDMGFAPDALHQLMAVAHAELRPVVGGLCFVQRQTGPDGMGGYRTKPVPTIFDWRQDDNGTPQFMSVPLYPVNSIVQSAATGAAFVLIHRSVLEKIAEKYGPTWYDRTPGADGKLLGEDVSFCVRAATVDVPVHVHTGVRTTHFKHRWLGEVDHWREFNAPPATDEVAVVVPVLRRPQNAAPFMTSLRASTGLATVYAVADNDDQETAEAWRAAGAQVLLGDAVTFAKKVNLAYSKTSEPWLFLTGDDVRFNAGWLDHAQHVGAMLEAHVVGTNDLGNPRVVRGEHATHMLVRRSYVDEVGASWDGPGVVCHEGYRHCFVDDELVTAAKVRGVWQMALGSVVEHNHPHWEKAEQDEVYRLGESFYEDDGTRFRARLVEQGLAKPPADKPKVGAKPRRKR